MRHTLIGTLALLGASAGLAAGLPTPAAAEMADFEDFTVDNPAYYPLAPESYYTGYDSAPYPADNAGEEHPAMDQGIEFYNNFGHYYDPVWEYESDYWHGWAVSNKTDVATAGFGNQYSAFVLGGAAPGEGIGAGGSENYGIGYIVWQDKDWNPIPPRTSAPVIAPPGTQFESAMLTNTAYAYHALLGDDGGGNFVTAFTTGDYFRLDIYGVDENGQDVNGGNPVEFYLADFADFDPQSDDPNDFIVTDWTEVDLTPLTGAVRLEFTMDSTDADSFGLLTPTYFAMDNLVFSTDGPNGVPEPSTAVLAVLGLAGMALRRRRKR